jgi:DNA-binding NtrC family response regulator
MARKIMIVHSNEDTAKTIETILKKNGYATLTAETVEECIKKLQKEKPQIVLIESFFPREKILQATQKMKGIKVLYIISDEAEKGEIVLYQNVVGFVNEPSEVNKFAQKINETWNKEVQTKK